MNYGNVMLRLEFFGKYYEAIARVHNISRGGEYLTAYIPCTNALRQVTPIITEAELRL